MKPMMSVSKHNQHGTLMRFREELYLDASTYANGYVSVAGLNLMLEIALGTALAL